MKNFQESELKEYFPIIIKTRDQREFLKINCAKDLEFLFFLLLNTCHDCFPESKTPVKKKFELRVVPNHPFQNDHLPSSTLTGKKAMKNRSWKQGFGLFKREKSKQEMRQVMLEKGLSEAENLSDEGNNISQFQSSMRMKSGFFVFCVRWI